MPTLSATECLGPFELFIGQKTIWQICLSQRTNLWLKWKGHGLSFFKRTLKFQSSRYTCLVLILSQLQTETETHSGLLPFQDDYKFPKFRSWSKCVVLILSSTSKWKSPVQVEFLFFKSTLNFHEVDLRVWFLSSTQPEAEQCKDRASTSCFFCKGRWCTSLKLCI